MREEVEKGHELDRESHDATPLGLDDNTRLLHELLRMTSLLALLLGTQELLALRETHTREPNEETSTGTDVEQVLEAVGASAGSDGQVEDRREEVAERVALLQDSRHQTTGFKRNRLEGHGDGAAPDASHADTEERTDTEEGMIGRGVGGTELKSADDEPGG